MHKQSHTLLVNDNLGIVRDGQELKLSALPAMSFPQDPLSPELISSLIAVLLLEGLCIKCFMQHPSQSSDDVHNLINLTTLKFCRLLSSYLQSNGWSF